MSRCCAASGSFPVKDVPGHDEDRQPSPNPSNAITVRSSEIMVFAGCSACLAGRLIWLGRVLRIWWPAHSRWHEKIRAVVSALDELIVGLDAAILVEDEDLQAGSCRCAAVGGTISQVNLTTLPRRSALSRDLKVNFPGATNSSWARVTRTSTSSCPQASRTGEGKPSPAAAGRISCGGWRMWAPSLAHRSGTPMALRRSSASG